MIYTVVIYSALLLLYHSVDTQSVVPISYNSPAVCSTTQFFHPGNLSCVSCGSNANPASDGVSCLCKEGYYENILTSQQSTPQCISCGASQVTSVDGYFCLSCDPSLTFDNGICSTCDFTSIYVDSLPSTQSSVGTRSCVSCPAGMWAGPDKTSCVPCGVANCTSCVGSLVSGGVCLSSSVTTPSSSNSFPYYNEYYSSSLESCSQMRNQTACQLLLNLCVLMRYTKSDPSCEQAIALSMSQPHLVPLLYYPQYGADDYLSKTTINTRFSTISSRSSSSLVITAAKYALNGTFLGLSNVTESIEIILCVNRLSQSSSAWRIGVQYEIQCELNTEVLLTDQPIFYDLFLYDEGNDPMLVPLPVLLLSYEDNGEPVNSGSDRSQWQLTRRFFLSQSVTNSPSYASHMHLRVRLKSLGSIEVPYVRISYTEIQMSSSTVETSFTVLYEHDGEDLNIALSVTVSVFVIIGAVCTGVMENGYLRRQGSGLCEAQTIVFVIITFCSMVSSFILLILGLCSLLLLVIFKGQNELLLALPVGDQETAFIVLLVIAFVFRFISVLYIIWKQVTIDIFLIDWEKPKVLAHGELPGSQTHQEAPVSIWRCYFVANEWNEIQCLRRIRPVLVLLMVLLVLEVVGVAHLCERDTSSNVTRSSDRYSAPHSLILRFSVSVVLYLIFALCMRAYIVLIHERFIENKIQQFVDFCSISNVSVFILSHNLYGHYIHGRSVHGNSDTNMRHMNENLKKEQENQCGRRGLLPDSDEQTFEVAVTKTFKAQYNKILAPIIAERAEGQGNIAGVQTTRGTGITDVRLQAYENMTSFLSSVIDHSSPECDHVVKKKLLLESKIGMEFHEPVDRSIFYQGNKNSFADVLFYNNEWMLLSFDVLLFCVVDLISTNFILSAIVTYLSIKIIQFTRSAFGKRNLGRKTLVDSRFLI